MRNISAAAQSQQKGKIDMMIWNRSIMSNIIITVRIVMLSRTDMTEAEGRADRQGMIMMKDL